MSTTITFFPVGDGDMMSRIISSVAGIRRLPHEVTSSSPAAMPAARSQRRSTTPRSPRTTHQADRRARPIVKMVQGG